MPADRSIMLQPGRLGLNVRDHPGELRAGELQDSINWQIPQRGALVKRMGFTNFGTNPAPAAILEEALFSPVGGTQLLIAYCANGQVYKTSDGTTWTSIASGLSTTARPSFIQYLDKIYWVNGVDSLRSYDGTTVTTYASAPVGRYLAIWRNRLYIAGMDADRRRVDWSAAFDPLNPTAFPDFSNTFNRVQFPNWPAITAIYPTPNISAGADGSDGVLVFTSRSLHRIIDDTDNAAGAIVGGANVLVDRSHGCISYRTLASQLGRLYLLAADGIYSTEGHDQLRLESRLIGPIFEEMLNISAAGNAIGLAWESRYLFAFTPIGASANTRMLELYLDLPANEEGQHPWMAHDVPAGAWVLFPATSEDKLYFVDSSSGDTARVRQLFQGGADLEGASTLINITARGKTGANLYDNDRAKRVRRILLHGWGVITVSVSPDFSDTAGESRTFTLAQTAPSIWNDSLAWNDGSPWGQILDQLSVPDYYDDVQGRFLALEFVESSQSTSQLPIRLSTSALPTGGAAITALELTLTPLDI